MFDAPETAETDSSFECLQCGTVISATDRPGECPDCGGDLRDRSNAIE